MKRSLILFLLSLIILTGTLQGQNTDAKTSHSVLPSDGVLDFLPKDSNEVGIKPIRLFSKISFVPKVNFFFRPETTLNYKEATALPDSGNLNFYLRSDFGGRFELPKNIDLVLTAQSYGIYNRSRGPLDPLLKLYEGYVDMKKLDKAGRLSLRFGRIAPGKYGSEMIFGDLDFAQGRSFESLRFRYKTKRTTSDIMWIQLYQLAPPNPDFEWNRPLLLANFNTVNINEAFNVDANLLYVIDQYKFGYRTRVLMPDIRLFGKVNSFRYSAEFIYQGGTAHGILVDSVQGSYAAHALEVSAGYESFDSRFEGDITYYRASGDSDPTDNQLKTFNVFWQNQHRRWGHIDAFNGANVQTVTVHADWQVGKLVGTGVHGVMASVLEPGDASPGIATIGSLDGLTTNSKMIGFGGDFYVNYFISHQLNMQVSTSIFQPGEYFKAVSGLNKPMIRLYAMMAVGF